MKKCFANWQNTGSQNGKTLAKFKLPLSDSVESFLLHRDPIINATTQMMKRRDAFSGRVVDAIPMADHVMDEALVALVAAHQNYCNGIKANITRGVSL